MLEGNMTKETPKKQTSPLPPNQSFVDANKEALRAVEERLAAQKKILAEDKKR
jgi:hypothetical protein